MASYELWLTRDDGTRLAVLDDWERLEYTLAVGEVGTVSLTLPGDWERSLFAADRKVEVWRKPKGGRLSMERAYLLSGITRETDSQGLRRWQLGGVDGNDLLRRRIVAYDAGTTGAKIQAAADSIMKDIVRLNLSTGSTDTDRVYSTGYFTVEPKSSAGPSVVRSFSRRDVLGVCQEVADLTKETTGPTVMFDVTSPTPASYQFITRTGQLGLDHTYPSGVNPVILGLEYGNLTEPRLEEDYSEEHTVVYGGGQGEGSDHYVYEIEDAARSGRSIWGRKEAFRNASDQDSTTAVQDEARVALAEGKPRITFSGRLVDSPGTQYGVHWRWGDKVTAGYEGQSYATTIEVVRVVRDAAGEEIEARLGYEE